MHCARLRTMSWWKGWDSFCAIKWDKGRVCKMNESIAGIKNRIVWNYGHIIPILWLVIIFLKSELLLWFNSSARPEMHLTIIELSWPTMMKLFCWELSYFSLLVHLFAYFYVLQSLWFPERQISLEIPSRNTQRLQFRLEWILHLQKHRFKTYITTISQNQSESCKIH